ncbi:MAG: S1-like domain-containing RNA-binding protein [Bacteroidota bacterium]|nr:S1-like domain-containing RNA-binding protein [Bacteroidota bacterium]
MIKIGDYNKLEVVKAVDFGVYLDGGDTEDNILMPAKYVPEGTQIGDTVDVFVYTDSEDRLVATTETPLAKVGDFAALQVEAVNRYGAFVNWGIIKDLMVPFREQKTDMEPGSFHVVYIYLDDESDRPVASAKVDNFLSDKMPDYKENDEVDVLIYKETEIGYKAVVDNKFGGLLYKNQVFKPIEKGDKRKAYIQKVRTDGKIDLILQKPGYSKIDDVAKNLLYTIRNHGGFMDVNDKSAPDRIKELFGISKKSFKKAVGALYKDRLIKFESGGIKIID